MDIVEHSLLTRRSFLKGSVLSMVGISAVPGISSAGCNLPDIPQVGRAVVFTDLHIGWNESNIDKLLYGQSDGKKAWDNIIGENKPEEVIFLGDVFDLWRNPKLKNEGRPHNDYVNIFIDNKLKAFTDSGGRVSYVVGNHDYHLMEIVKGEGDDPAGLKKRLEELEVKFYHPFYQFKSGDNVFVATHGDNYNFLYLPVSIHKILREALGGKDPEVFKPTRVYDRLYEVIYKEDRVAQDYDQRRLFSMIIRYLIARLRLLEEILVRPLIEELLPLSKKGVEAVEEEERLELENLRTHLGELRGVPLKKIADFIQDAKKYMFAKQYVDSGKYLEDIVGKQFSESFQWKNYDNKWTLYHPYRSDKPTEYFCQTPDVILMGHYHKPSPEPFEHPSGIKIYDVGAWVKEEGLSKSSYATITNGEVSLKI